MPRAQMPHQPPFLWRSILRGLQPGLVGPLGLQQPKAVSLTQTGLCGSRCVNSFASAPSPSLLLPPPRPLPAPRAPPSTLPALSWRGRSRRGGTSPCQTKPHWPSCSLRAAPPGRDANHGTENIFRVARKICARFAHCVRKTEMLVKIPARVGARGFWRNKRTMLASTGLDRQMSSSPPTRILLAIELTSSLHMKVAERRCCGLAGRRLGCKTSETFDKEAIC